MENKEQIPVNDDFSTIALIEREPTGQNRAGLLHWWHRIAAPPPPAVNASLREREAYRRGRYISNTLLALLLIVGTVAIVIGGLVNHALLPNLIPTFLFLCIGTLFNRRGRIIISGIIVVLVLDASIMTIIPAFGQMTPFLLPVLDLLVLPELFAASLLPPRFVFIDMLLHIIYCACTLTFLFSKNAELLAILHQPSSFADALAKPVVIQIVTAVVSYTWMRSVTQSVERADRATSLALLEKDIAEQAQREAEQKYRLESEIQEIMKIHAQVANGNFDVRVSLKPGDTLWPVAGSLNNLIVRFRNLLKDAQRLKQIEEAIARFFTARNEAQNGPIPWQPTGTPIDVLAQQHNTFTIASRPLHQRDEWRSRG